MCYYASWQNFANMGSPANLTITARTASKFCARSRSQSQNIFDLDSISWVISGSWEPWPECHWEFWKQWLTNGFGYLCDSRDPFAERGQHSQMALAIASLWFHQSTPSEGGYAKPPRRQETADENNCLRMKSRPGFRRNRVPCIVLAYCHTITTLYHYIML